MQLGLALGWRSITIDLSVACVLKIKRDDRMDGNERDEQPRRGGSHTLDTSARTIPLASGGSAASRGPQYHSSFNNSLMRRADRC